jgi:hypothetical protein
MLDDDATTYHEAEACQAKLPQISQGMIVAAESMQRMFASTSSSLWSAPSDG